MTVDVLLKYEYIRMLEKYSNVFKVTPGFNCITSIGIVIIFVTNILTNKNKNLVFVKYANYQIRYS